jgi:hypothetical protein
MAPDETRDASRDEGASGPEESEGVGRPSAPERPLFQHPQWMVGVVLIFAVVAVVAGFDNPIWLLIGSPFILALVIYLWARLRP